MSIVPAAIPARRRFLAYNPGNEEIPPHAAAEWSIINSEGAFVLRKPNKDDSATAVINTETAISPQGYGYVTKHLPTWALYNAADGDPVNGESIGTRAGYWQLHRGYEGFLVWGGADGEKVYVQSDLTCRNSNSGGYGYLYGTTSRVCCMCARFTDDPTSFPSTLTATITASCIGTRTITLSGGAVEQFPGGPKGCLKIPVNSADAKAFYNGIFGALVAIGNPLTDFYESKTDCASGVTTNGPWSPQEYLQISTGCYLDPCYDSGSIKYRNLWLTKYFWVIMQPGKIEIIRGEMYNGIASCSPFAISKSGVFQCYNITNPSLCDYVLAHGYIDNNWSTYTSCVGGSIQLDIDE